MKQQKVIFYCIFIFLVQIFVVNIASSQEGIIAAPTGVSISRIDITGNQRIEASTIESYLLMNIGDSFTEQLGDASLKRLYNTGLFSDVDVGRRGSVLVIEVSENPIINRIVFEGNRYKDDEDIYEEIQLRPRIVFSRAKVRADVQRILEIYRRGGRFSATIEPKVIQLEQNRVNLVFEISEGSKSVIGKINFLGNRIFNNDILRTKVMTKESRWWKFLSTDDTYDPDRLNYDQQLLRDFYREQGYADFRITSSVAELSPDKQNFFINISVEEGELYDFGEITVESQIEELTPEIMIKLVLTQKGEQYDSSSVDASVEFLTEVAGLRGYAFVDIRPQVRRNRADRTIDINYVINEAPRVYVEEIKIIDNVRTHDKVIRRELRMVEGDAYNSSRLNRSEVRVRALQFFKEVSIEQIEGTAADKTILEITVEEQPTGELSAGLGYSSFESFMINFSIAERNLLGKGQFARLGASLSKRRKEVELSFTEPYFMDRRVAVGADIYMRNTNFIESGFQQNSVGSSIRTAFPLTEFIVMNLSYGLSKDKVITSFFSQSPYIANNSGDFLTSALSYGISYNTLDDRQKPNRGQVLTLLQQFAGLGGNEKYIRTTGLYQFYYPIYKRWVFNVSLEGGHIQGLGRDVRLNRRFFLGNPKIRGFKEAGIGPREYTENFREYFSGFSLGGNTMYKSTLELFIPLGGGARDLGIEASAYVDAGAVFNIDAPESLINEQGLLYTLLGDTMAPRVSVGIGFSWASPFGPFRIDLAKAIRKQRSDESEFFQFNVGTRF
ncbi:MAG: outer membrane protein assembly factor BamA [Kordiimonadaceae bacterium]|nr:outer membrane protein assembly factor BamA [Kordiimonadaceae bacterium]MBT6330233.1 outer membrane protein assembly factor BamA [Kordiimonadaceae bacterium]